MILAQYTNLLSVVHHHIYLISYIGSLNKKVNYLSAPSPPPKIFFIISTRRLYDYILYRYCSSRYSRHYAYYFKKEMGNSRYLLYPVPRKNNCNHSNSHNN